MRFRPDPCACVLQKEKTTRPNSNPSTAYPQPPPALFVPLAVLISFSIIFSDLTKTPSKSNPKFTQTPLEKATHQNPFRSVTIRCRTPHMYCRSPPPLQAILCRHVFKRLNSPARKCSQDRCRTLNYDPQNQE